MGAYVRTGMYVHGLFILCIRKCYYTRDVRLRLMEYNQETRHEDILMPCYSLKVECIKLVMERIIRFLLFVWLRFR